MDLSDLPSLKDVIAAHDLRAQKSLGQNFLMDPQITDRIAAAAGDLSKADVTEIGPGPGGLTRSILRQNPAHLYAVEFDPRAVSALQDLAQRAKGRLTIMQQDAMKMDYTVHLTRDGAHPHVIISNLPYNISVPLLMQWLQIIYAHPGVITCMILMFQKEVADRILAHPHTGDYGRVSVLAQFLCDIDAVMTLAPGAFVPPPKVYSTVLRFTPKKVQEDRPSYKALDHVLSRAFSMRRKMLRGVMKDDLQALEQAGIDVTLRAENVPVQDYIRLAQIIEKIG